MGFVYVFLPRRMGLGGVLHIGYEELMDCYGFMIRRVIKGRWC